MTTAAFELLHPAVQRKLYDLKWTELRPVQVTAIQHLRAGRGDCVVCSATASGKTEAAFLPVLSAIADEPLGSVRAMYVGPLKALINDQFRRVEELCARMEMPVHKWHGDVDAGRRRALLTNPGGVLLITPESLEAMFVLRAAALPSLFAGLRYVVVDELHALIGTERGAQLRSQLARLHARTGCNPTRIGLSATLAEPARAAAWLRPGGPPAAVLLDGSPASALAVRVTGLWRPAPAPSSEEHAADASNDPAVAQVARRILLACRGRTNLVFANAKARIEMLAEELASQARAMSLPDEIVVHHGSLSKEQREHAEARLREARPCTAVCSNTLELGVDIGDVDCVVQVAAPWSVASLMQRVGRSGRRGGRRTLRAYLVEDVPDERSDLWDRLHLGLVQGVAAIELMLDQVLEPLETRRAHLSTLVHQILSTLAETGGIAAALLFGRLVDSGAFSTTKPEFATLLRELGRRDLVEQLPDGSLILGVAAQPIVGHYSFYAAFRAQQELAVVHGTSRVGTVLHAPLPGESLLLAGRRWRVVDVDATGRQILVEPGRGKRPPIFATSYGSTHALIHHRMFGLLTRAEKPSYLDEVACEILAASRATADQCHRFDPIALADEGSVRLFVFRGGAVQRTLGLALSAGGIEVTDHGVGFDLAASPDRVRAVLAGFAGRPDGDALARIADDVRHTREIEGERFDAVLPGDLWRAAFVRERLDVDGAAAVASEAVRALSGATTQDLSAR